LFYKTKVIFQWERTERKTGKLGGVMCAYSSRPRQGALLTSGVPGQPEQHSETSWARGNKKKKKRKEWRVDRDEAE
jgi:hypothetical protein